MAKQINRHIKLRGTIDDISFYKSQDGFLARAKGGVGGDRIKNDPRFRNTRLNGLEFGTGGKASKLFRHALNPEIKKAADNRVASRITQFMVRILKTDPINDYGERKVTEGDLTLLNGFEFNTAVPFGQALKLPFTYGISRVTGQVAIDMPALLPAIDIAAPENTTHFNFFAVAAAVDFELSKVTVVRQSTANQPWDDTTVPATAIDLALPPNSTLPLFLLLGIEFKMIINGKPNPLSPGLNAFQLLTVDLPV